MIDIKQRAVNKLVLHLQRLGYVNLTDADLALVKQALHTFRSSKAAARFLCATLGGKGKCLAPLPTLDVRNDKAAQGPATRIPSPEEIRLRGMELPKPVKVAKVVLPRVPSVRQQRSSVDVAQEEDRSPRAASRKKPRAAARRAKPQSTTKAAPIPKDATPLLRRLADLERMTVATEAKAQAAQEQASNKRLQRSKHQAAAKSVTTQDEKLAQLGQEAIEVERELAAVATANGTTAEALKAKKRDRDWDKKAKEAAARGAAEDRKLQAALERARSLLAQHDAQTPKQPCAPCEEAPEKPEPTAKPPAPPAQTPTKAAKPKRTPKPMKKDTVEAPPPSPSKPQPKPTLEAAKAKAASKAKAEPTPTDDGTALVNELAAQLLKDGA